MTWVRTYFSSNKIGKIRIVGQILQKEIEEIEKIIKNQVTVDFNKDSDLDI